MPIGTLIFIKIQQFISGLLKGRCPLTIPPHFLFARPKRKWAKKKGVFFLAELTPTALCADWGSDNGE
jgi:hypothetical protein